jgi:predicted nucleic acid-binding protein
MDFLDTNVLVYRFDDDAPSKQRLAREAYVAAVSSGTALISTQVLQEFYVTLSGKFAKRVEADVVLGAVRLLAELPVVQLTPELILAAIAKHRRHALSFWDALIVQAAIAGRATRILSEDLQHGLEIEGVRVVNPFLETKP